MNLEAQVVAESALLTDPLSAAVSVSCPLVVSATSAIDTQLKPAARAIILRATGLVAANHLRTRAAAEVTTVVFVDFSTDHAAINPTVTNHAATDQTVTNHAAINQTVTEVAVANLAAINQTATEVAVANLSLSYLAAAKRASFVNYFTSLALILKAITVDSAES